MDIAIFKQSQMNYQVPCILKANSGPHEPIESDIPCLRKNETLEYGALTCALPFKVLACYTKAG